MFFHPGFAARNGVNAVLLAEAGGFGSPDALDGESGLFAAHGKRAAAASVRLFEGQPEILAVDHKPVPACNFAQTACQAALALAGAASARPTRSSSRPPAMPWRRWTSTRSAARRSRASCRPPARGCGSMPATSPMPLPAYNPGKAAIARLTQLLAAELGRHSIRVNSVGPTYVMTPELQARIDSGQRDLAKMMGVHALNLLPTPEDIAGAMAFLCSPAARAITGILLPVASGFVASASYMTYAGGVPWGRETPADATA